MSISQHIAFFSSFFASLSVTSISHAASCDERGYLPPVTSVIQCTGSINLGGSLRKVTVRLLAAFENQAKYAYPETAQVHIEGYTSSPIAKVSWEDGALINRCETSHWTRVSSEPKPTFIYEATLQDGQVLVLQHDLNSGNPVKHIESTQGLHCKGAPF